MNSPSGEKIIFLINSNVNSLIYSFIKHLLRPCCAIRIVLGPWVTSENKIKTYAYPIRITHPKIQPSHRHRALMMAGS